MAVKFYRGKKELYLEEYPEKYKDGIYFATDTKEIIMNNDLYGFGSFPIKNYIKDIQFNEDTGILKWIYIDDSVHSENIEELNLKDFLSKTYETRFRILEARVTNIEETLEWREEGTLGAGKPRANGRAIKFRLGINQHSN